MNLWETYGYLIRARRDLWASLEGVPDSVLSAPLLDGSRFRCIKDLIFHIAEVEDGWTNGDLRGQDMVQNQIPSLREGGPDFSQFPLAQLLDYWRQVEQSTLAYFATLTEASLREAVRVDDWPEKALTVDGILSHVLIHEIRHTAQIAVLLRTQKIKPPSLDLLFYLPLEPKVPSPGPTSARE